MRNKYIPKKLKFTIILNALYQRSHTFTSYTPSEMLENIGKILMPSCDAKKFRQLYTWYRHIEFTIMDTTGDWAIRPHYVVDYANMHNIKLYSREYLCR